MKNALARDESRLEDESSTGAPDSQKSGTMAGLRVHPSWMASWV